MQACVCDGCAHCAGYYADRSLALVDCSASKELRLPRMAAEGLSEEKVCIDFERKGGTK